MPRIPDESLDRLKHEIPLVTLAERSGVELKRMGHELMGRCAFHQEDTPSLSINAERNVFQCFGCGAAGTPIDWVMREKSLDFRQAVEVLLRDFYPSEADEILGATPRQRLRRSCAPELPSPFEPEASEQDLLNRYTDLCHAVLKESPVAQEYLRKRGLDSAELVSHFELGYADRSLGLRLPEKGTKAGAAIRVRLQKLGILRESGHEHMVGSLVIAIRDEEGNVRNLYGRKTRDDLRPGTPDHLYLPGPRHGVFNPEALRASSEVILCESLIDALTFWRWGLRNVTTAWGAGGFTDEILGAMKGHRTERVLIAFDRDEAGESGARKVGERLMAAGIECFRVLFPKGMDVNEVALKMQPADKTLGLFLRSAEWMGKGAASHAAPRPSPSGSVVAAPGPCEATEEVKDGAAEEEMASERAPEAAQASPSRAGGLVKVTDDEAELRFDDRRYRLRGLSKCRAYSSLRVSLKAERESDLFAPPSPISGWHMDTLDLCVHRARQLFERVAAHELGVKEEVVRFDLGRVLKALEEVQDERIAQALAPKVKTVALTAQETEEAHAFLSSPDLLSRITSDLTRWGLVGEGTNKLVTYLGATSRLLERPLAILIQSSSAAGKTSLMEAVLALMPEEQREKYTAVSGKSLFYFDDDVSLSHKILAIVEEEGAEKATYPLKILQSEGELVMASTGKDPHTGRLVTKVYKVKGPVMIILTTTAVEIDPELENRCLRLTVDESREQTRRIHELQRRKQTLEGLLARKEREKIEKLHRNAQRLLRPVKVLNPFVEELTFVDDQTRTRRDHEKYLTLIETIAFLHQRQREIRPVDVGGEVFECVTVALEDIEAANRIASEVLGKTLDELPPQTRRFLQLLHESVSAECGASGVEQCDLRFSRRDVRAWMGWGDFPVRIHLGRLIEMEYVLVHRGGRGQSFVYELLWRGEGLDDRPFVLGLVDAARLRPGASTTEASMGENPGVDRALMAHRGPVDGLSSPSPVAPRPAPRAALHAVKPEDAEIALPQASPVASAHPLRRPRVNLLRFPPTDAVADPRPLRRRRVLTVL